MPYQRLYDFQPGTTISSSQVDDEFNQLINAANTLEADLNGHKNDDTRHLLAGERTKINNAIQADGARLERGSTATISLGAGGSITINLTFSQPYTSKPVIFVTPASSYPYGMEDVFIWISNVTTTGFEVKMKNKDASYNRYIILYWQSIGV